MMDYKEKYDAALERARKELQEFKNKDCDDTTRKTAITIIHNLFPELQEDNEDNRIRKGIIRNLQYLMDRSEGFVKEDLEERISWLEKQGERKPLSVDVESMVEAYKERLIQQYNYFKGSIFVDTYLTAFRHGIENTLDELNLKGFEKQGEQHSPIDINKMVNEFAHTEVKGYGIPSMIEVAAYRKGIEDALEKQGEKEETPCDRCRKEQSAHSCQDITGLGRYYIEGEQKTIDYEHADIPQKDFAPKVEPKFKVCDFS